MSPWVIVPVLLGYSAASQHLGAPLLRVRKEELLVVHVVAADIGIGKVLAVAGLVLIAHLEGVEDVDGSPGGGDGASQRRCEV